MKVLFTETTFWDTRADFKVRYENKILRAAKAAGMLLPGAPQNITFVVQPSKEESIPEYGSGAWTKNSCLVILSIDPGLPYGEEKQIEYVRQAVFHEMSHAARFEQGIWHENFIDRCILEGLATVFEREHAGAEPLYGEYDADDCKAWLDEIETDYSEDMHYQYMFQHKDGRKWIGYKVGTYVVDEAHKKSGKSIAALTNLKCAEIKQLSGLFEQY
jgi:hypothetical protein